MDHCRRGRWRKSGQERQWRFWEVDKREGGENQEYLEELIKLTIENETSSSSADESCSANWKICDKSQHYYVSRKLVVFRTLYELELQGSFEFRDLPEVVGIFWA